MLITPTVGRVVHYHNTEMSDQPCCALITYVHSDHLVNLAVFDAEGEHGAYTSVTLVQPGEEAPEWAHASWMPYQVKKHTGSESGALP